MHLCDARQAGKILAVDAGEIVCVLGHHLQQIVGSACHQVTFQNVRHPPDLAFKGFQHLIRLSRQGDFHEYRGRAAQLARVQKGNIGVDHPLFFQPLHPPVTGRRRQVHPLCQFGICQATFFLQCRK